MKGFLSILLFGVALLPCTAQDAPKRFKEDMPNREISGKFYDFLPIIRWANEYQFLSENRPVQFEDGTRIESDVRDWEARWKKIELDTAKWEPCLVIGRVIRIQNDGILIDCGKERRLLTHFPGKKTLRVDDYLECLALPDGACDIRNTAGKHETVYIFNHGVPSKELPSKGTTVAEVEAVVHPGATETAQAEPASPSADKSPVAEEKTEAKAEPKVEAKAESMAEPPAPQELEPLPLEKPVEPSKPPPPAKPEPPPKALAAKPIVKPSHIPYRLINNTVCDFRPIIQWENEFRTLTENRPSLQTDGTPMESDVKDWDKRWHDMQEQSAKWAPYLVDGIVIGSSSDGVLVSNGSEQKLVKNYPRQAQTHVGDWIGCLAKPIGPLQVKNEGGKQITYRVVDHGTPAQNGPIRFEGQVYRVVDGRVFNLTSIIRWASEYEFLNECRPQVLEDGSTVESSVKNWELRWRKALEDKLKWQAYLVAGKVIGISKDGVIVERNGQKVIVQNYPRQGIIQPGDTMECVALPLGFKPCEVEQGGHATVRVYDYGTVLH
jgi:hypothetical protein